MSERTITLPAAPPARTARGWDQKRDRRVTAGVSLITSEMKKQQKKKNGPDFPLKPRV